jgi:hypothetical protein
MARVLPRQSPENDLRTLRLLGSHPESGGVTQARRLDQLPARLAEVIHLMTGIDVDPSDIDLDIRYDDDLGRQTAELRERRADLEASEKELATLTAATARALRNAGWTSATSAP